MNDRNLPPGQRDIGEFPRFGLTQFADRFPRQTEHVEIQIGGDVRNAVALSTEFGDLPRTTQTSDFHCVTTWTARSLHWGGFRFSDFFEQIVVPVAQPEPNAKFVLFRCQDGYSVSLPLDDLMADGVLLADQLDEQPLTIAHGAPLRLVAPAHYGYKNAKHLKGIEFWRDAREYRPAAFRFMDHPRARVDFEERGRWIPGRLLRLLYRPLVRRTIRLFEQKLNDHIDSR